MSSHLAQDYVEEALVVPNITPFMWFDSEAEEAVEFYISVFSNSMIHKTFRYGTEGKDKHAKPPGSVMTIEFEFDGHTFTALNGGPHFRFTPALSFVVHCMN